MHIGNDIHPSCIIDERVLMGTGNQILPNTTILGPTTIGDNNIIGPNVVIGSPGQDSRNPRYDSSNCQIEIGSNNIIREFTAIQKPAYRDITKLGSNIFLMQSIHVPHDAIIYDDVIIAPMTVLGGIVTLMTAANIGIGVSFHQFTVVGPYAMIAMGSSVVKNVKPFSTYIPGKAPKVNHYAIKKFGYLDHTEEIEKYVLENAKPTSERVGALIEEFEKVHADSHRPLHGE